MARRAYCNYCRSYVQCTKCSPGVCASTQAENLHEYSLIRFLQTPELSDVDIVVESGRFPDARMTIKAHRVILALHNEVFKAMFYGDFAKEDRVVITDLHPEGVLGLLRYFYSGHLQVESALQAVYTRSAANKYLVPELEKKCVDYAKLRMTVMDVCPLIDYFFTMGEHHKNPIFTKAIDFLRKDSLSVLSSKRLESCLEETIHCVLKKAVGVPEISVLRAVFAWSQEQCLRRASNGEDADIRKVMQPFFPKLRFLAITAKEFASGPNQWGILNDHEARALLNNIVEKGSMPLPDGFSKVDKPRE